MRVIYQEYFKESSEIREGCRSLVEEQEKVPELGESSVLIQVKACGISFQNYKGLQELFGTGINNASGDQKRGLPFGQDIAGIVSKVGPSVTNFSTGDEVTGIIPMDTWQSGCSEYIVLNSWEIIKKPESVSFVDAAACVGDGFRAYVALHYLARVGCGDTVLVLNGAASCESLAIQLAHHWGAKVITTASSEDEYLYLTGLSPLPALTINLEWKSRSLVDECMEETSGLGVDVVMETSDVTTSKHQILSVLAVGGRWVTANKKMQLYPPESNVLYMKCGSLCHLFEQAWLLSGTQVGRYQHILRDIMSKLSTGILRPNVHHTIPFDSVSEATSNL